MGRMIGAAEFKAHCLRILDEVERTGEPVTITKRGRIVGELHPPAKRNGTGAAFGFLKNPRYFEDNDLASPAYDRPWNAELGILD
ncbi:MAG TPA: type II toxin-antitoxin system Phd/YefM family antitoxin [Allosphingosinicella sp.]|jgi:antitoxin (DNA-binding transcriptional repressor) of toxin-antitoxin stability system